MRDFGIPIVLKHVQASVAEKIWEGHEYVLVQPRKTAQFWGIFFRENMQFLTNGEIRGEEKDVFFAQLTSKILRPGLGDLDVDLASYSYGHRNQL